MGYTHYWKFKEDTCFIDEKNYQKAIRACSRIIRIYYKANGGLSGYTAHTPICQYHGIKVNGKQEICLTIGGINESSKH